MYDWRIVCNKAARQFANEQSLTLEPKDFGHLEHFHYGGENVCDSLIQSLQLEPSCRILDAGCGIGGSARTLASRKYPVVGVDANREFVQYAESISSPKIVFQESRLEDLTGLQYDAWFALLVFVHIGDRASLFQKLENDCSVDGRFFIETIVSNSNKDFFDTPVWSESEVENLMPSAQLSSKTAHWKEWTQARVERFLARQLFFENLYGSSVVEQRIRHYEKIAEGFETGALKGRRIVGRFGGSLEIETDLEKTCIIEFDQLLDIT